MKNISAPDFPLKMRFLPLILLLAIPLSAAEFALYELPDLVTYRLDIESEIPLYGYSYTLSTAPLTQSLAGSPFDDLNGGGNLDLGATTEPLTLVGSGYYRVATFEFSYPLPSIITVSGTLVDSNFNDVPVVSSSVIPLSLPDPSIGSPLLLLLALLFRRQRRIFLAGVVPWVLLLRRAA